MQTVPCLMGKSVTRKKRGQDPTPDSGPRPAVLSSFRVFSCVSWALLLSSFSLHAADCTQRYRASAFFRVPGVRHLSGIAVTSRSGDSTVCAVVSDKDPFVYAVTVPVPTRTVKTEAALPARKLRAIPGAEDLEDIAFDKNRSVLWICAEARSGGPSMLYRVPMDSVAPIASYQLDSIHNQDNNGAEGIAVVPSPRGDELWIAKERFIPPKSAPPVFRFRIDNTGNLGPCVGRFALGLLFHRSQSGMVYDPVSRHVWIISRELRILYAIKPASDGTRTLMPDSLSCTYAWDDLIDNHKNAGMAEGIAFNDRGDLLVGFDTGDDPVGLDAKALTKESRIVVLRR